VVRFDPEKVIAVVESQYPDNGNELKDPGPTEVRIAEHIIEFLEREVQYGRMPANLLPLQSGGVSLVA
jgi:acetyl-CoA hydrolase